MQLTKQQKIAAAVLALAVAAFITDRWVIGHDDPAPLAAGGAAKQPASTGRRPVARPVKQAQIAAAAGANAALYNVGGLASRLEIVRINSAAKGRPMNLDQVRDAFRPPPTLVGSRRVETVDEQQEAARRFMERHKLAAVVRRQSGGGVAIIEDRNVTGQSLTVAVGQKLEGFTLVAVKDRVAVLRRGAQRVELRLQDDANPGSISTSEKVAGVETTK